MRLLIATIPVVDIELDHNFEMFLSDFEKLFLVKRQIMKGGYWIHMP